VRNCLNANNTKHVLDLICVIPEGECKIVLFVIYFVPVTDSVVKVLRDLFIRSRPYVPNS